MLFAISLFEARGTVRTSSSTIRTSLSSDPNWQLSFEMSLAMTRSVPASAICLRAHSMISSLEMLNSALKPTRKMSGLIFLIWRMILVAGYRFKNRELEESIFLSDFCLNSKSETAAADMKMSQSGIILKIASFISLPVSTQTTSKTDGISTLTLATTKVKSAPLM